MAGTYYENTSAALLGWGSAVDEAKRFHSPGNMRISTRLVVECYRLLAALRAERDALLELVNELEADAARYRWLRSRGFGFSHDEAGRGISAERWGEWCLDSKEGFAAQADAAIDAAMRDGKS